MRKMAQLAQVDAQLVGSINGFGVQLVQALLKVNRKEPANVFLSPCSISTAMAMAVVGADKNTLKELLNGLNMTKLVARSADQQGLAFKYEQLMQAMGFFEKAGNVTLRMANVALTVEKYPWHKEFIAMLHNQFRALTPVFSEDKVLAEVNSWVSKTTEGKITTILEELPLDTKMVILNAIYFKGLFLTKFDIAATATEPFQLIDEKKKDCQMMSLKAKLKYCNEREYQAVEIPYHGGDTALVVFLPNICGQKGIDDVMKALQEDSKAFSGFTLQQGHVQLPRFTTECTVSLKDTLPLLGIKEAFRMDAADFSKMTPDPDGLYISEATHKAFVEVNEDGTKAAAATVVVMSSRGRGGPAGAPFHIKVDRPFVFCIRNSVLNVSLFLGVIYDV